MQHSINFTYRAVLITALIVTGISCKKQKDIYPDFATLQLFGAIQGGTVVVPNFSGKDLPNYLNAFDINSESTISYANKKFIYEASVPFSLHAFPDTMPSQKPAFSMNLQLEKTKTYSFFVFGPTSALDTLFFKEEESPSFAADDTAFSARIINLMTGDPLKVIVKTDHDFVAVNSLPYKGKTGFIKIPLAKSPYYFTFEIRDAATDELIITFEEDPDNPVRLQYWLFRSKYIILTGMRGGSGVDRPRIRHTSLY